MVQDTNTTIVVRKAVLDDVVHKHQIHKVVNAAYRAEGGWTTEKDLVHGERSTIEDIENHIKDQVNILILAFETKGNNGDQEERVVGTIQIQHANEEEAELGLLSVDPSLQSKGIGGKLVRAALKEMKEERHYLRAVMHLLEVRTEILVWYKKLGFEPTGERIPFVWPALLKIPDTHFITLKKTL
ncbi:acyl-CoA N-acyltransferase [Cunninghamella echinulata]|nr:acyl-CoA N-acyltransferase [Cunninghamella echinulata]